MDYLIIYAEYWGGGGGVENLFVGVDILFGGGGAIANIGGG